MTIFHNHLLERVLTRFQFDSHARDIRAVISKTRFVPRITTPAQAVAAVALHRAAKEQLWGAFDQCRSHHTDTHTVLSRRANDCLVQFTNQLVASLESSDFQQQCLLEMASLVSLPVTDDNVVVFEVQSPYPQSSPVEPCVRFYRPPVLARRVVSDDVRTVVRTPRWVYDVMQSQLVGAAYATHPPLLVGDCVRMPSSDVLACAVHLWQDTETGAYTHFSDAVFAARELV